MQIINIIILIKDKNIIHLIISMDAVKAFDKIQHPFTIKTTKRPTKWEVKKFSLMYLKSLPLAYSRYTQWEKTKSLPLSSGTRMVPHSHHFNSVSYCNYVLVIANRQEKDTKVFQIGKVEVQLLLFCVWHAIS